MRIISKEIQNFINEFIHLIDENKFYQLFEEARHLLANVHRRELVEILTDLEIPFLEYMHAINANLYYSNPIMSIEIPGNIKTIERYAFANSDLHSIKIEEGCVKIDQNAFVRCVNLRDLWLPSTIGIIGHSAFGNCPNLINIKYNGTVEDWNFIQLDSSWFSTTNRKVLDVECADGTIQVYSSLGAI